MSAPRRRGLAPLPESPVWITLSEAAQRLRLSTRTLRRWKAQGRFATFRVSPHRVLVRLDELDALVTLEAPHADARRAARRLMGEKTPRAATTMR
jgi:excisionase family DNA binding protein